MATLRMLLLATVAMLGCAAPARATDVMVTANALRISDQQGANNGLDVRYSGLAYVVYDDFSRLSAGAGCTAVRVHQVMCPDAMLTSVRVDSGDGADVVLLSDIKVPVEVDSGSGNDLVQGGIGNDGLAGGAGRDTLLGGTGDDTLDGNEGGDLLEGGTGADRLLGGDGADVLRGQEDGGDRLVGGGGPDLMSGGPGDDVLNGGPGPDVLVTGLGTDKAITGTDLDPVPGATDQVFGTAEDTIICGPELQKPDAGAPPPDCRAPRDEKVPVAWPPAPDSGAAAVPGISARAAIVKGSRPKPGRYPMRVSSPGSARTLTVSVKPVGRYLPVRVRVERFGKRGKKLPTFTWDTETGHTKPVGSRGPGVYRAVAICCS